HFLSFVTASPSPTEISTLSLHDALPIWGDLHALVLTGELQALLQRQRARGGERLEGVRGCGAHVGELLLLGDVDVHVVRAVVLRSEEHTSELQSRFDLVCRLLLEKKK